MINISFGLVYTFMLLVMYGGGGGGRGELLLLQVCKQQNEKILNKTNWFNLLNL